MLENEIKQSKTKFLFSFEFKSFSFRMLPSEFSAYIKQKEQIQQSRIGPIPFVDNNNATMINPAIIRPPNYRNYYNPYVSQSPYNSSMFNNDLPLRPNTLPLTNGQSSIYVEQQMTSSTS